MGMSKGEIILFSAPGGKAAVEVRLEQDTAWLTQSQMVDLFQRDQSVIARHLSNIFRSKELDRASNMQKMHTASSDKPVTFYSLDAIISVGYRVNSKRGTQFRTWATRVLKDHLVKGYSVNNQRLKELRTSLRLVKKVVERVDVTSDESRALLSVVSDYAYALDLLDDFDHRRIAVFELQEGTVVAISYDEAVKVVEQLREKFGGSDLFGREKDESLNGSLGAIMQTFGGRELYPSLEAKAAHLLYFLVKNHSFVDGNKRIAAALFLWFLERNAFLYRPDGTKRIADNALVALTIMIAASDPAEKDDIVGMTINLINRKN
jgi:prophage maintenance system killer protein